MKNVALFTTMILALAMSASAQFFDQSAPDDPPMAGIVWAQGTPEYEQQLQLKSGFLYPYMYWHGGTIMPQANVAAIFWGGKWKDKTFVDDKITGLDTWYGGFGNSKYAGTSDEYIGWNGIVTSTVNYAGHIVDPVHAALDGKIPVHIKEILTEVCQQIANPDPLGYYPVYVDLARPAGENYCGWHSWGSCGSTPVQFAFFWNLDGDAGCDPGDGTTGHSQGLAALSNISAHELSEARTDPRGQGWYDANGLTGENGDKCNFIFSNKNNGVVTFSDGTSWKVQEEWSNIAYFFQTGDPNGKGKRVAFLGSRGAGRWRPTQASPAWVGALRSSYAVKLLLTF